MVFRVPCRRADSRVVMRPERARARPPGIAHNAMMHYTDATETDHVKRRITLDLDESLLGALDGMADRVGESRAGYIVESIRKRLAAADRERIDAAFAGMAHDAEGLAAMARIGREFDSASDAAWKGIDRAEKARQRPRSGGRRTRGTR